MNNTKETVEEFLARGGKVQKCKPGGSTTTTNREFIKKDPQLKELRKLRAKLTESKALEAVESAIHKRVEILK